MRITKAVTELAKIAFLENIALAENTHFDFVGKKKKFQTFSKAVSNLCSRSDQFSSRRRHETCHDGLSDSYCYCKKVFTAREYKFSLKQRPLWRINSIRRKYYHICRHNRKSSSRRKPKIAVLANESRDFKIETYCFLLLRNGIF